MAGDYSRWLATETTASLAHDRPCAPCSSAAGEEIWHGPLGCPRDIGSQRASELLAKGDDENWLGI